MTNLSLNDDNNEAQDYPVNKVPLVKPHLITVDSFTLYRCT